MAHLLHDDLPEAEDITSVASSSAVVCARVDHLPIARLLEPLLNLHREGELTQAERQTVQEHLRSCQQCTIMHEQLLRMDAALMEIRGEVPETRLGLEPNELMGRLNGMASPRTVVVRFVEELIGLGRLVRPALATLFVSAIMLLVFQEVRDAVTLAELEKKTQKPIAQSSTAQNLRREINNYLSETPGSVADESLALLGSVLPDLFGSDNTMFARLAKRYPNLARVNPDDGLNSWERNVLATEGQAFLREVEKLIRQGNN